MKKTQALEKTKKQLLEEIAPLERELRVTDGAIAFLRTGPKIDLIMNAITKLQEQRKLLASKRFALSLKVLKINVTQSARYI